MKKKLVSLMLACTMLFSLSACGSEEAAPAEEAVSGERSEETAPAEEAATEESNEE